MPTVYVTAPRDQADALAERLVRDRHAACVNVVPCDSIYRWEGDIVRDEEVVMFVKTTDGEYDDLVAAIEELHPYDVPCVERFDEADALPAFTDWVAESVE